MPRKPVFRGHSREVKFPWYAIVGADGFTVWNGDSADLCATKLKTGQYWAGGRTKNHAIVNALNARLRHLEASDPAGADTASTNAQAMANFSAANHAVAVSNRIAQLRSDRRRQRQRKT